MDDRLDSAANADPTPASDYARLGQAPREPRRARASTWGGRRWPLDQQWREEFPYHWRADDLVTRRDTLRFLVAGSGALFAATSLLAAIGSTRTTVYGKPVPVAQVGELAENESRVFTYPDVYAQGILVNLPGKGLVAYSDVCTHLSCAVLYQPGEQQFYCPCHDGRFDAYTGRPIAGPPIRPLPIIQLQVRDNVVYALQEVER